MTSKRRRRTRDLPAEAREVLAEGELCYVAASTRAGPHVTPVVFALDGGRLWLTTARSSAKARAWRRDPAVAGMVRSGGRAVVFRGTVRTYDALDPFTWPSLALSSPRLGKAATRFSLKNARFFFGYAVDATHVPFAWAPPGRVFTAIDMSAGRVLDLVAGTVGDGWGEWHRGLESTPAFAKAAAGREWPFDAGIPPDVAEAVGTEGDGGVLATQVHDGSLTVVPAAWRRLGAILEARLPVAFAELTNAGPKALGALVVDRASAWRAADMRGMLFRGPVRARGSARAKTADALVWIRPTRAVWWSGWSSGTLEAGAGR